MKIKKIREVKTPSRGTNKSAGIDFFIPVDFKPTIIEPGSSVVIPSGIIANVPKGHALIAFNKSGIAVNRRLQVGACVVDEDYQGEIHINLINIGNKPIGVATNEKIVQFILLPIFYDTVEVIDSKEELFENITERGAGWKGSTGIK